jgi:NAD(P)-dependent dehydrogenase (short-subunit alcohol dehydrogenase family)
MKIDLSGRSCLVSGGGTGIGLAIADRLAAAGAAVAVAGRRGEVLAEAASELRTRHGGRVEALVGDVSDPADCRRIVDEAVAGLGGLHLLVNNAAVFKAGPVEAASRHDVDEVFDIDLKGPVFLLQAALPELRRGAAAVGDAAVLNISSSVTVSPVPNYSLYSAAKAGLETLTRCWAVDLAADHIRVNAIAPGLVRTPVFATMMPPEEVDGFLESFEDVIPLGRVGEPDDVARLALFVCSPLCEWMTGAIVPLDGGLSLASSGS